MEIRIMPMSMKNGKFTGKTADEIQKVYFKWSLILEDDSINIFKLIIKDKLSKIIRNFCKFFHIKQRFFSDFACINMLNNRMKKEVL